MVTARKRVQLFRRIGRRSGVREARVRSSELVWSLSRSLSNPSC